MAVEITVEVTGVPDSGFYTTPSMYGPQGPSWSTRNVSMTFFGRSKNWLQDHVAQGHLVLDGEPMTLPRTLSGDRPRWRLSDVERATHALTQNGYIDTAQLLRTITMIKMIAVTWGFIDEEGNPLSIPEEDGKKHYPDIRIWAREHGWQVGARGRIPQPIVAAYLRATDE